MDGKLVLQDGTEIRGTCFGSVRPAAGEVVFNTGMVGYPECITDPSYRGQILVFTYPLIGNYGAPSIERKEQWESDEIQVSAVVMARISRFYDHPGSDQSLEDLLRTQDVPGMTGVDTRALTRHLRSHGTLLGKMLPRGGETDWYDPGTRNLLPEVSNGEPRVTGEGDKTILVVDFGCKRSIETGMLRRGFRVKRVPWDHPFDQEPADGVLLSSGPGDPRQYVDLVQRVARELENGRPLLGVCLGHQLVGLAAGAEVYKLPFGHRSQNQPCLEVGSKLSIVTSQNHGYAVKETSIGDGWRPWFFNGNDGSCEGLRHATRPQLTVQFHPEARPGPTDAAFVFDRFAELVRDG